MKLSYIITPFENGDYLVRCINSLKRQIECDYEIILSETGFGENEEKVRKYLELHPEVKCFEESSGIDTKHAKLEQALNEAVGDYIVFLDVNTVTAPCAGRSILKAASGDMVLADVFVREKDKYITAIPDDKAVDTDALDWKWICYRREFALEHKKELFSDRDRMVSLFDIELCRKNITKAEEACFYCENRAEEKKEIAALDRDIFCELANAVCELPITCEKIQLHLKYLKKLKEIMNSTEDESLAEDAYGLICYFGEKSAEISVLRRLFEDRFAIRPEEMKELSAEAYQEYLMIKGGKADTAADSAEAFKTLVNQKFSAQEKMLEALKACIEKMSDNVNTNSTNQHLLAQNIEKLKVQCGTAAVSAPAPAAEILNPVREVPQMFAQGKLGFSVILKSIAAWFRCKFRRKREA